MARNTRARNRPRISWPICTTFLLWQTLLLSLLVSLLMSGPAVAQNTSTKIPPLTSPVTDLTATLSADQAARLEAKLRAFEGRKGSQVAVLIVPTTLPETIDQYAIRVAEQWKVGRARVDDGAILVVARDDRTLRIEVGYGLEGALNDATSKRIMDEIIVPRFRQGDFAGGIEAGTDAMVKVIEGEPLPPPARAAPATPSQAVSLPLLLLAALAMASVLRAVFGRVPGALLSGGLAAGAAWLLVGTALIAIIAGAVGFAFALIGGGRSALQGLYLGGALGHGGRDYHGGGGLGGIGGIGGGFGGGGGGWGGGGGSFGGGGASGRW